MKLKLQQEQKKAVYWAVGLVVLCGLLYLYDKSYIDRTGQALDKALYFLSRPIAFFSILAI